MALSDQTGARTAQYTYSPFGEGGAIGIVPVNNPYQYTSRRMDFSTGIYYVRNRDYHPSLGRFLQSDPLGYGDGMNLYTYVGNDPLNWIDPFGLARTGTTLNSRDSCFGQCTLVPDGSGNNMWVPSAVAADVLMTTETGASSVHDYTTTTREEVAKVVGVVSVATGVAGGVVAVTGPAALTSALSTTSIVTGVGAAAVYPSSDNIGSAALSIMSKGFVDPLFGKGPSSVIDSYNNMGQIGGLLE